MFIVLNDQGGDRMDVTDDVTTTLRAEAHHPPIVLSLSRRLLCTYGFKPQQGAKARGMGWEKEVSPTLSVGTNHGVCIEYECS